MTGAVGWKMSEGIDETNVEEEAVPGPRKGRMTLTACTECRRRKLKASRRETPGSLLLSIVSDAFQISAPVIDLSVIDVTTIRRPVLTTFSKAQQGCKLFAQIWSSYKVMSLIWN